MRFNQAFLSKTLNTEIKIEGFDSICSDTRQLRVGDAFVAIRGENFDGHDFVKSAFEAGASAAIVDRKFNVESLDKKYFDKCLVVDDCTGALRELAKAYRQSLKSNFFVVAGSNGKTTTKEYLAFLCSKHFGAENVFKTEKSENSILGIALNLLRVQDQDHVIMEVGIDEPGWMQKHLEVVQPTHGLITVIQEEHLEKLENIETVAQEELRLLHYLRDKEACFAANLDSSWIRMEELPSRNLSYSLERSADLEGLFQAPRSLQAFGLEWRNPLPGKHNAQNLLAALSGIRLLKPELSLGEIRKLAESISDFKGEKHRSIYKEFPRQIFVYDDCYNANPSSMESSLETFLQLSEGMSKVAVIADMRELGPLSESAHKRILNLMSVSGFERIFLFGECFTKALEESSISGEEIRAYENFSELMDDLKKELTSFRAFFIKGSRGMQLERALRLFEDLN